MAKTFTQKINRQIYRNAKRVAAIKAKTAKVEAKAKFKEAKAQAKRSSRGNALESSNPIRRKLAEARETSMKKHEVKLRKLETDAKLKEMNPKLAADQAKAKNRIEVEKAKHRSKTASATAYAAGAAALGKGLSDENNQDDRADRDLELAKIRTIFGSQTLSEDDGTGLKQGVE